MSTMAETTKPRRERRQFDDEFKAGAVRLVLDEGKTVGRVARDLDLTESALRVWVDRARADRTKGRTGLTSEEREELRRLRKENRQLRLERDILKNVPGPWPASLAHEKLQGDTVAGIREAWPSAYWCPTRGTRQKTWSGGRLRA